MDSLIKTFHIDTGLILAQLLNFALVFAVLYFFALKPLAKIMGERTATIEKGLDDAKNSVAALAEAERKAQELLAQTRSEAQSVLTQAKQDAEEKRNAIISQAKADVAAIVTNGKNQLAQEKLTMVAEAKAEVVELVSASLKKVLAGIDTEKMDKASLQNIIDKQSEK